MLRVKRDDMNFLKITTYHERRVQKSLEIYGMINERPLIFVKYFFLGYSFLSLYIIIKFLQDRIAKKHKSKLFLKVLICKFGR